MGKTPELSDVLDRHSASLCGDPGQSFTVLDLIAVPRNPRASETDTVVLAEWQARRSEPASAGFALLRIRDGGVLWAASWRVDPPAAAGTGSYRVVTGHLAHVSGRWGGSDGVLVALGLEHLTRPENHLAVARVDEEGRLRWLRIYDPVEKGRRSQVLAAGIVPFDDDSPSGWRQRPEPDFLVHGTEGLLFRLTADGDPVGGQRMYRGAGSVIGTQLRRAGDGFYAIGRTLGPETYGWILHVRDVEEPLWERAYASTEPDGPCWFGIALGGESLAAVGGNVFGGLQEDSLIALLEPTHGSGGMLAAGQVREAWTLKEEDDLPLRLLWGCPSPIGRLIPGSSLGEGMAWVQAGRV